MNIPPDLLDYLASNLTQKDIDAMLRAQAWSALTIQQQKQAIQKVIEKILVYKDHIRVHLTVAPVLFTAHSLKIVRRKRVIQDELIGMDEKPDFEAICRHAMDADKARGRA